MKVGTKVCGDCQQEKQIDDFYRRLSAGRYIPTSKCKVCKNKDSSRWWKTPVGKHFSSSRKHLSPEKYKARNDVNNALLTGNLEKPRICVQCGDGGRIEGHHEDYNKPLEVIWLCRTCHVNIHKAEQ